MVNVTISIATMVIGVYLIRANAIAWLADRRLHALLARDDAHQPRRGLLMQYYSTSRSLSALDVS